MITGQELVLDLAEQLNTIKLPLMALKLDELYRSPDYPTMDKLDFLSEDLIIECHKGYLHKNICTAIIAYRIIISLWNISPADPPA